MTREKLIKIGLSEAQAVSVMKELDGSFVPKSRFNEVNSELKQARLLISEQEKSIDEFKNLSADKEALLQEIETLKADCSAKDELHFSEIKRVKIDAAANAALMAAGAKNLTAARALLSLDDAELDQNDRIIGLSDHIENLQNSEESSFLFSRAEPKIKGAVSGETGVDDVDFKVDLESMSYEELCAFFESN